MQDEKLKITIKGRFQKFWTNLFLKWRLQREGIIIETVTEISDDQSELLLIGERKKLWKAVHLSRKPMFFVKLDRVVFQFLG